MQCVLEDLEALFLAKGDGEQDGFHRVVAGLIRGRLRVATGVAKQTVEAFLIIPAQGTAEFCPSRCGLFEKLTKCGNGAAHSVLVYGKGCGLGAAFFSLFKKSLPSSLSVNFHT
jgi:hypothetical protein